MNADSIEKYENTKDEGITTRIKSNFDNAGEDQMQSNGITKKRKETVKVLRTKQVHRAHLRRSSITKLNSITNTLKQRNKPAVSKIGSKRNSSNEVGTGVDLGKACNISESILLNDEVSQTKVKSHFTRKSLIKY